MLQNIPPGEQILEHRRRRNKIHPGKRQERHRRERLGRNSTNGDYPKGSPAYMGARDNTHPFSNKVVHNVGKPFVGAKYHKTTSPVAQSNQQKHDPYKREATKTGERETQGSREAPSHIGTAHIRAQQQGQWITREPNS